MRHFTLLAALVLLGSFGTGCATLVRGDKQKLAFNTDPAGATVTLDDGKAKQTVTTPATVPLKRKDKYAVEIAKPGFQTLQFDLAAQWDGATIGNAVLPGGSIGAATDRASGADLQFYKLETIKLSPGSGQQKLVQHRGKLYTDAEYQKVLAEEIKYKESMQQLN
jgi:hypothetical protein